MAKIVLIAPLKIFFVDHVSNCSSNYMTTIYHYFCIKKNKHFKIYLSKNSFKICSKTHQIAPLKKFLMEHAPEPPSKFAACNSPKVKTILPPPPW